jgi:hypothetical protein
MISMSERAPRTVRARRALFAVLMCALVACVSGCATKDVTKTQSTATSTKATVQGGTMAATPAVEPQHIQVQHILIGFTGSVPGKTIKRTQDEAKTLAYKLADRARAGESFDDLVKENTDDAWPGIYGLSNKGVTPATGEYARGSMVAAFGNVGFKLAVGEIGIADYDPAASPFGYHVIKRIS